MFVGGSGFLAVFGCFAALYTGLGVLYLTDPARAFDGFSRANRWLGGVSLAAPDVPPWRYVTAIGMITLGLMCLMLAVDLRRNYPVLVPAAFFKLFNAVLWFAYYEEAGFQVFLAAGLLDVVMVGVMVAVAVRARRRLDEAPQPRRADGATEAMAVAG